MRRFASLAITFIAIVALAAPAAAATSVAVGARDGWVSTGISVTKGQVLDVTANGQVHTAPIPDFHVPGEFKSASGPEGQDESAPCGDVAATFPPDLLAATGPCALDEAYFGELIGRVGNKTFRIGASDTFVAPARGTLDLAVNDLVLTYGDNTGAFNVLFE